MALKGGAVALVAVLAAMAVAALASSRSVPADGVETTYWLAIESLAVDGDSRLEEEDRARFTAVFGRRPVHAQVVAEGDELHLDAPWLWTRLAAWARAVVGRSGVPLFQWGLFAWTAAMAAVTLASRVGGGSASLLALVALVGSAAVTVPLRLEPRALEMAALASAAAVVWFRRLGPARPAEDVFRGSLDRRASAMRWLVAGLLFGPVLVASPAYLPLALPILAAAPTGHRSLAGTLFGAGLALTAGSLWLLAGPPWEPLAGAASVSLYGWSALGLLLGRGVGVLPYFVPAVLLLTLGGRADGKRWVLPAVAASIGLQVALAPFDYVDGVLPAGNAWFLPLLALLLLAAESIDSPRATLAVGAVGGLLLAAPWLAALGAADVSRAVGARMAVVEGVFPLASTLRRQPAATDLARGSVAVRGFAPGFAAGDAKLHLRGARGELLVTSDRPLSSLRLELGRNAPASIEVRGGEIGNVTYRPNGEMGLDVTLGPRRARRHPVWWSPAGAWIYPLELRLPQSPAQPIALDLPFARPAVPRDPRR